jgi:hypothetical protein
MKMLIAALALAVSSAAFAQGTPATFIPGHHYPAVTLRNGQVYRDIRVLSLSTTEMRIRHASGDLSIPLQDLAEDDLIRTGITVAPGGISSTMNAEERRRTGIDKLSPAEQKGLQDWIIRAAEGYYRSAQPKPPPPTAARRRSTVSYEDPPPQPRVKRAVRLWSHGATLPSHGHYITAKERSQQPKIRLEDGSIWEISPSESPTMFLWQPADEITLLEGDDPHYPVTMVNLNHRRSVNVRLHSQ